MKINVKKINWIRIEKGLSLTELVKTSGVSMPTISRLLKDEVNARPDTVGKIAIALGVDVKELFIPDEE